MKGRCLCGDVTWSYRGDTTWNAICHCESCRRSCSAPVVGCIGALCAGFRWTGAAAAVYLSSPGVERLFCGRCGSAMAYLGREFPNEIFLYAASLEEPATYMPEMHVHYRERVPWLHIEDDLPKFSGSKEEAKS